MVVRKVLKNLTAQYSSVRRETRNIVTDIVQRLLRHANAKEKVKTEDPETKNKSMDQRVGYRKR